MAADEIVVRYFAEAEEAAGCAEERIPSAAAATVGDLRRVLVARHGAGFGALLGQASILVDGVLARDDEQPVGETVDILPLAAATR